MDVNRLFLFLLEYLSLITICIKLRLKKYFDYILKLFIKLKNYIMKKRTLFFYIKVLFSFITLYHCIVITVDYLGFKYRYNLIVEDNSEGFEWKPISICTESKVLFDKHKVIQYFNLSMIFFEKHLVNRYTNLFHFHTLEKFNLNEIVQSLYNSGRIAFAESVKIVFEAKFYDQFVDMIFDDLNFAELSSLIVNENELFECSAKFHHKNQSINSF